MKSLSKLALCLLLAMSLTVSAFAAQVAPHVKHL